MNEPDWIRQAVASALAEARAFLRTAWAFTRAPATFARRWAEGAMQALNPLAFMATAAAIVGTAKHAALRIIGWSESTEALWSEVLSALAPYAYYVALGAVSHLVLRLGGSRRHLRTTAAVALYAGGGPGALGTLVSLVIFVIVRPLPGHAVTSGVSRPLGELIVLVAAIPFLAFLIAFGRGLAGIHGLKRQFRCAVALALAVILVGVFLGATDTGVGTLHFLPVQRVAGHLRIAPSLRF
jgi:hypothetical protein